jgi:hypothetical protein
MNKRDVFVPTPCHERWETMRGDHTRRFCAGCAQHVYDLSEGSEQQAKALLATSRETSVCVRYRTNSEGTLLFRSEHLTLQRRARNSAVMAGIAGSLVASCVAPMDDSRTDTDDRLDGGSDAGVNQNYGTAGSPNTQEQPDLSSNPRPLSVDQIAIRAPEAGADPFMRPEVETTPSGAVHTQDEPRHFGTVAVDSESVIYVTLGRWAPSIPKRAKKRLDRAIKARLAEVHETLDPITIDTAEPVLR